ncbi:MAG: 3-deoxy-manno-octulosonate cytidylyltransferase [Planctomycetota bacterium]
MALAVIPARLASQRLPGKPLLDETGRPLIAHVVDAVRRAASIDRLAVATDDPRIAAAAEAAGAEAVMTRDDHPNGTSRIAEAVDTLERSGPVPEVVVNVQGDEPEVDPAHIDALVAALTADPDAPMATLAAAWSAGLDPANPNIVKLVTDAAGRALYFSRAPIPHDRDATAAVRRLHHVGLYAYRRPFLPVYVGLSPTPLERAERLEQLRVLEHGHAIRVAEVAEARPGIDTPEQYAAFVARWKAAHPA